MNNIHTTIAITRPYGRSGHRRRIVLALNTAGNCQKAIRDDNFQIFCNIEIPTNAKEFKFWSDKADHDSSDE